MSQGGPKARKLKEMRACHEKAYRRGSFAKWDALWSGLSVAARSCFLNEIQPPVKSNKTKEGFDTPTRPVDELSSKALKELVDAGFVKLRDGRPGPKASTSLASAADEVHDFSLRLNALQKFHPQGILNSHDIQKYVEHHYDPYDALNTFKPIAVKGGYDEYYNLQTIYKTYVLSRHWPEWAAATVGKPVTTPTANAMIKALKEAGGPIPATELVGMIDKVDEKKARATYEALVEKLAFVEDLDPKTLELTVDFLPEVRRKMDLADHPPARPPLLKSETLKAMGPEGSIFVDDLRALLLEIVGEPPKIRQDRTLFQKEIDRFERCFEPLIKIWMEVLDWDADKRLDEAFRWASILGFIKFHDDGSVLRTRTTPKGDAWLASSAEQQTAQIFDFLRIVPKGGGSGAGFHIDRDEYELGDAGDYGFLGSPVAILKAAGRSTHSFVVQVKPEDRIRLRKRFEEAFETLEPGVFYQVQSIEDHLLYGPFNPLHLGLGMEGIDVVWGGRPIRRSEEDHQEISQVVFTAFLRERLIPHGCLQMAVDDGNRVCLARRPRLDLYFGRKNVESHLDTLEAIKSKVIVQPDFSVIVIGMNTAPVAALAPFCERTTQGGGQGASIFKITKDSVVKAVRQGLKPEEIVARLTKNATAGVPPNVLKEVEIWAKWVKLIPTSTIKILRCPDRDVADRIVAVLKKNAERLNDTLIAFDPKSLTPADHQKLRNQGIHIQSEAESAKGKNAKKKGKR